MPLTGNAKTRISVSTFSDKSGTSRCAIRWWGRRLGSGFQDQMISALVEKGRFDVQERGNLKTMYNEEHNLINSDSSAAPRKNRFKAAHYSITGAVTSFEMCSEGGGSKLNVGKLLGFNTSKLKVGGKVQKATVVLDIRVVDVEQGSVIVAFKSEGKASSTKFDVNGSIKGAEFGSDAFKNSPIGEASREAIDKAVKKISFRLKDKKDPKRKVARGRRGEDQDDEEFKPRKRKPKNVCMFNSVEAEACKIIAKSKSGKKISVLNVAKGKKVLLKSKQVYRMLPVKKDPKLGRELWVSCKSIPNKCYENNSFRKCIVSDQIGDEFLINCKGKEYQTPKNALFRAKSY